MTEYATMTKANLQRLVAETEETLVEIKAEIERRENEAQEEELQHLDVHFKNAELSLQTIRNFFAYLRDEMKSKS